MNIVERIAELCEKEKTKIGTIEKELSIGHGTIKKWEDHEPQAGKLLKIANRFHVSIEYLLTGSQKNNDFVITPFEYKLIVNYRQSEHKAAILHLLDLTEEAAKEKEGTSIA